MRQFSIFSSRTFQGQNLFPKFQWLNENWSIPKFSCKSPHPAPAPAPTLAPAPPSDPPSFHLLTYLAKSEARELWIYRVRGAALEKPHPCPSLYGVWCRLFGGSRVSLLITSSSLFYRDSPSLSSSPHSASLSHSRITDTCQENI